MAFDNVTFPYYPMKHGIKKTIIDPVSVVSNGTREYRIKRQAWERYEWTLPTQTMTNEQKEEIKAFLLSREHSLNSFKFVDPDASAYVDATLTQGISSSYWKANLPTNMSDQSVAGTHPLFNIDPTGLTVSSDGTPVARTITLDITDGEPILDIDGVIPPPVTFNGPIQFTVRLASTLSYALAALDTNNETLGTNTSSIKLIEVFGEY